LNLIQRGQSKLYPFLFTQPIKSEHNQYKLLISNEIPSKGTSIAGKGTQFLFLVAVSEQKTGQLGVIKIRTRPIIRIFQGMGGGIIKSFIFKGLSAKIPFCAD